MSCQVAVPNPSAVNIWFTLPLVFGYIISPFFKLPVVVVPVVLKFWEFKSIPWFAPLYGTKLPTVDMFFQVANPSPSLVNTWSTSPTILGYVMLPVVNLPFVLTDSISSLPITTVLSSYTIELYPIAIELYLSLYISAPYPIAIL